MAHINAIIKLTRVYPKSGGEPFDRTTSLILEGTINADTFALEIQDLPNKEMNLIQGILQKEITVPETIGNPVHGDEIDCVTMDRLARREESEGEL